tara:strand:+ start:46488 stop:47153 length:666 start_codon:yes stop_codon:yes gene_type:complete
LESKISNYLPLTVFITNSQLAGGISKVVSMVSDAVDSGVNVIQIRERQLDFSAQLKLAKTLREVTYKRALLFINDQSEIARLVEADGIQIPEQNLEVMREQKNQYGDKYFSCSVHGLKTAQSATSLGADLLVAGTIFHSASHQDLPPSGVNLIKLITSKSDIPVVGIGGINVNNANLVIQSGADGVAVISEITQSPNPKIAAADLVKVVQESWALRRSANG